MPEALTQTVPSGSVLEEVACIVCGSRESSYLFRANNVLAARLSLPGKDGKPIYSLDPRESSIVRCKSCSLTYLNPRRSFKYLMEINDVMHATKNYKDNNPASGEILVEEGSYELHRDRIQAVAAIKKSGKWLDVGCGSGRDLEWVGKYGFECYGVELSPVKKEYYANKNFNVHLGSLPSANFPENYFDVISMWDVLEHMTNPEDDLKEAARVLKDDGLLVIKVPNIQSLFYNFDRANWDMFHPAHLYYFNEKTLGKLLSKYGFQIAYASSLNPFSPGMMAKRFFKSFSNKKNAAPGPKKLLAPRQCAATQPSNSVKNPLKFLAGLINYVPNQISLKLRKGNFLLVYAQKKKTAQERRGFFKQVFHRLVRLDYRLERLTLYRNPRKYWTERGGDTYFKEQESYQSRQKRSDFLTTEIAKLPVQNALEVGCGYGKQIRNLQNKSSIKLFGMDFSHSQLMKADEIFNHALPIVEADAARIPFKSDSFDLVYSSAVILHNKKDVAQMIVAEMIRTSRGYLLHNEDKNVTSTRYAYDFGKFYEALGFAIVKNTTIPDAADPSRTQFLIVRFTPEQKRNLSTEKIYQTFRQKA